MRTKINVLSAGRFHVCDLARELDKNGFDVKFYSFVPSRVAARYGLPRRCSSSVIAVVGIFLFLERCVFKKKLWARTLRIKIQDYFTGLYMRKCDICIAMSGDFVYAIQKAKKRGSIVILERGSKHILEQRRILGSIPSNKGKKPVPDINVKRELAGYEIADYISLAAHHMKESFLKFNYPEARLFINPYGVDLSMFKPLLNIDKQFDIIMVGKWGYQKGCDLLVSAFANTELRLLHVGAIGDIPFPGCPNFVHVDPVRQDKLVEYYNQAHVFVLPSRQEGLALVQAQAIACNLPIVGSLDTGAVDLKEFVDNPEYISIVNPLTVDNLINVVKKALLESNKIGFTQYGGESLNKLTWKAYGERYADFLTSLIS